MNIKEHIEAGHYPKDEKGRALVPTRGGEFVTICATDKPGPRCLIGWSATDVFALSIEVAWDAEGRKYDAAMALDLMPPPPRKVREAVTVLLAKPEHPHYPNGRVDIAQGKVKGGEFWTALPGIVEYEKPWS